ncbi:MAG TPA: extracellular solute-binding protein [Spirochaetota bacterium]|nr:extracellular solute-binding protein [Spirochaetota bacterium]
MRYLFFTGCLFFLIICSCVDSSRRLQVFLPVSDREKEFLETNIFSAFTEKYACSVNLVTDYRVDLKKKTVTAANDDQCRLDLLAADIMQVQGLTRDRIIAPVKELAAFKVPFYPALQQKAGADNGLSFVFFRPRLQLLYYHKKKLQGSGVKPLPDWAAFLKKARLWSREKGPNRVMIKGPGKEDHLWQLCEYIIQAGGDPFVFNDQGCKQAFAFFRKLWPHLVHPPEQDRNDNRLQLFREGRIYLMQVSSVCYSQLAQETGSVAVGCSPRGPANAAHLIGGEVLAIPAASTKKKLTLQFIRFMLSRDIQSALAQKLKWLPVRQDLVWFNKTSLGKAVKQSMQNGIWPRPEWAEEQFRRLFQEAFARIVTEHEPPALLVQFQSRMRKITDRNKKSAAPK